ncbi:MAG: hypothetical protein IJK55_00055 [Bacteroidales bacterium]|nr:hypothetical protein [Bacteroidales bacterium]
MARRHVRVRLNIGWPCKKKAASPRPGEGIDSLADNNKTGSKADPSPPAGIRETEEVKLLFVNRIVGLNDGEIDAMDKWSEEAKAPIFEKTSVTEAPSE